MFAILYIIILRNSVRFRVFNDYSCNVDRFLSFEKCSFVIVYFFITDFNTYKILMCI